jgi:triosephosphate isomerase
VIIVNFKAYEEVEGSRGAMISGICEEMAKESGVSIAVSPPQVQLSSTASLVDIPVFAQHVDAFAPGSRTGWITPSMVKAAGARGALINHSEHPVSLDNIGKVVALCKELDLITVVCADTVDTAREIAPFGPDFIAVEPPELIGGDTSVTTAKPEVVSDAVKAVHEVDPSIKVLCGAGVKTGNDVKVAIELGAEGVLLASGVVKASSIKGALRELVQYL